jgi:hypothetical protein
VEKKRAMEERSQIDAMRAAVRGDLERARSRRANTLLQPAGPPEPEPEPGVAYDAEAEPEPVGQAPERKRRFHFWRR